LVALTCSLAVTLSATETTKKSYSIPAGEARDALKQFSEQSGEELLYSADAIAGVKTNALNGSFIAQEALNRLLSGTSLYAVQDAKTKGFAVARIADEKEGQSDPKDPRVAPEMVVTAPAAPPNAATSAETEQEVIKMNPFIVNESEGQDSYQVTSTLAGTRVRTELRDLASPVTVITPKFMQDIGATNIESLLQYTTNTEVGGLYGNFAGLGNTGQLDETSRLARPGTDTRVRGLTAADNTRNYFLSDVPWDSYNVGRVDMARGPNSVLFGVGSPAGIINVSLNDASFQNSGKVETRVGSYGSIRGVIDLNYVPLKDELAFRVSVLDDTEQYQQKPAFNHDKRIYGAIRYDPKLFNFGSAHTSIKMNFEHGSITSNNPRVLPPFDNLTPWWYTGTNAAGKPNLNQGTFNPAVARLSGGVADPASAHYIPWFNGVQMANITGTSVGYVWGNGNSSVPSNIMQMDTGFQYYGINSSGAIDGDIKGLVYSRNLAIANYNNYSTVAGLPGSQYGVYQDKSLTDPSIYDFYNYLIDGPNKKEWQGWNEFNFDFSQTFLDNRLAFDAAYYHQKYSVGQEALLNGNKYEISVDINSVLVDGSANPNVGRPYVSNNSSSGNYGSFITRDSWRFTGYGELRADDFMRKSLLSSILGRHDFTALWSEDKVKQENRSWARYAAGLDWADTTGVPYTMQNNRARMIDWVTYLGPNLLSASSAANAHFSPITTAQVPAATAVVRYLDSHWNRPTNPTDPHYVNPADPYTIPLLTAPGNVSTQSENPANYVGWVSKSFNILNADADDIKQLYTNGSKRVNSIDSAAFVWQGYLWDGNIVPTVSWRRDAVTLKSATAPYDPITGAASMDYDVTGQALKQTDSNTSWGIVGHLPKQLCKNLPAGLDLSVFYNDSNNFKADTIRKDIQGRTIPNATGQTRDYGFVISAFNNRVSLKVDWYKTTVKDATLEGSGAGIGNNLFYLNSLEGWGTAGAIIDYLGIHNQTINGYSVQGNSGFWDWAMVDSGWAIPGGMQPRSAAGAASDAHELAAVQSWIDQLPPQSWFDAYGIPLNVAQLKAGNFAAALPAGWNPNAGAPSNISSTTNNTINGIAPSATVDTLSKGIEFELYARPTKNWDITINASKTTASRENLSKTLADFITYQYNTFNSPAGDLRLWWAGDSTIRKYWTDNIYGPYQFLQSQQGASAPEISPWRGNLITNYGFDRGMLKGVNIGAAYRWQQSQILGYALNSSSFPDVSKPYRGPSEGNMDLWVGYERKLTNKITWRLQLNLRNVDRKAHLVPISVEPDGSPAAFRIAEGMNWQLTNTFTF